VVHHHGREVGRRRSPRAAVVSFNSLLGGLRSRDLEASVDLARKSGVGHPSTEVVQLLVVRKLGNELAMMVEEQAGVALRVDDLEVGFDAIARQREGDSKLDERALFCRIKFNGSARGRCETRGCNGGCDVRFGFGSGKVGAN
jgi:hypothetical protein